MTTALHLVKPQLLNRGRPKKFTPETVQQVRNLVERGKSREEIAEIIGVTIGTLQVTCSKLGISLRRPTFGMGTGLLPRQRCRHQKNGSTNQSGSRRKSLEKECAERPHAVPEAMTTEQAQAGAPSAVGSHGKMHDGIPPAFAIRMQYKGQERSTVLPLDKEMIGQLALEAEIRGMRIESLLPHSFVRSSRRISFISLVIPPMHTCIVLADYLPGAWAIPRLIHRRLSKFLRQRAVYKGGSGSFVDNVVRLAVGAASPRWDCAIRTR